MLESIVNNWLGQYVLTNTNSCLLAYIFLEQEFKTGFFCILGDCNIIINKFPSISSFETKHVSLSYIFKFMFSFILIVVTHIYFQICKYKLLVCEMLVVSNFSGIWFVITYPDILFPGEDYFLHYQNS